MGDCFITRRGGVSNPRKLYIYNKGDMCTKVTGGWPTRFAEDSTSFPHGTVTENEDSIRIYCKSKSYNGMKHTQNTIDVTEYNKLSINVTERSGRECSSFYGAWMFLHATTDTVYTDASEATIKVAIDATGVYTIDLSNVTGSYYVRIESFGAIFTWTEVWMEK